MRWIGATWLGRGMGPGGASCEAWPVTHKLEPAENRKITERVVVDGCELVAALLR